MEILGFNLSWIDFGAWWSQFVTFSSERWAPSFGVLLVATIVHLLARVVLRRVQKRWAARTATRLDDYAVRLLRQTLLLSAVAWAIWRLFTIWSLPGPAAWAEAVWIALLFFPLSRFVGDVLTEIETRVARGTSTTLDDTALPLLNTVIRFIIVSSGVILALSHLGLDITPLIAGAGVMGLALSLAAKDTLSNLIAGVLLIIDRPFQVGDRIELWMAPNETGT